MKTYKIDFKGFENKRDVHVKIKEAMFDYVGSNLDALYDELTSICFECEITLIGTEFPEDAMGGYLTATLETFLDAEKENPYLKLTVK